MTTFLQFLEEANAAGSKFELKVAYSVQKWLKSNGLDKKWKAYRYQNVTEDDGNRDEDFSDVALKNLQTDETFFIECKQNGDDNPVTQMFDITEDFQLAPVKGKMRQKDDNQLSQRLATDLCATEEFQRFALFMQDEFELLGKAPIEFWFNRDNVNDKELSLLMTSYIKMVASGQTEADNKKFDKKLVRESTRNVLAVALMWRLWSSRNTWDICHLEDIQYFGDLMRKHYLEQKASKVVYMQLGDNLYSFSSALNPLQIDCQVLPDNLEGKFDLKFTPRFGTGSMYLTSRSKLTSTLSPSCSFTCKERLPKQL